LGEGTAGLFCPEYQSKMLFSQRHKLAEQYDAWRMQESERLVETGRSVSDCTENVIAFLDIRGLLKERDDDPLQTVEQRKLALELVGLRDQIEKSHFLNVHFRAFSLAHQAWMEHIRQNAVSGSRAGHSPGGAVLDPERDDR